MLAMNENNTECVQKYKYLNVKKIQNYILYIEEIEKTEFTFT